MSFAHVVLQRARRTALTVTTAAALVTGLALSAGAPAHAAITTGKSRKTPPANTGSLGPAPAADLLQAAGAPARIAELVGDGAWCWYQDPRAIHYVGQHDRTYVGYVTTAGDIDVVAIDATTGLVQATTLHPALAADDHAAPGLEVLPDGRVVVFYTGHNGSSMVYRISTAPEDVSAFGPEITMPYNVAGPYGYTYANPIYLSAEHRTYLFFRGADARPTFTYSDDNLQTWSPAHTLVLPTGAVTGQRPYAKYATNGKDTIYFTFDDGHPRDIPNNSVYYMAYRAGEFWHANGTPIASLASVTGVDGSNGGQGTPISNEQADKLYDGGGADGKAWVHDVGATPDGRPVILFASFPNDSNHRYHYASWNGSTWVQSDFTGGGGSIATMGGETEYSGGLSLDPNNPSIVYTSIQAGGSWEIQQWRTSDGGATFAPPVSITTGSTDKNVRPVVPWGPPGQVKVLWMSGTYNHWLGNYNTSIEMLTTGRAPTTSRVSISAPAVPSNQKVTVAARAVYGFGGQPVPNMPATLWARPSGASTYHQVASQTADALGLARWSVEQKKATRYLVSFGSTSAATGSDAPSVVVGQKVATAARVSVATRKQLAGHKATVTARLVDADNGRPLAHQVVTIQYRVPGAKTWARFATVRTNGKGLASASRALIRSEQFRAVFASQPAYGSSASASTSVRVQPVDAVRLAVVKPTIAAGKSAIIEARVVDAYSHHAIGHAPVTLWASEHGHWVQVGPKRGSNGQGLVHWTVSPTVSTIYQVRAGAVGGRPAVNSATTVVHVH